MNVYYVVNDLYEDESFYNLDELRLFQTEEAAQAYANELNNKRFLSWEANRIKNQKRWETEELAVEALEKIGIDWTVTMPYHKREWNYVPFNCEYVVRSLEVE